jgi:hypothetical protein
MSDDQGRKYFETCLVLLKPSCSHDWSKSTFLTRSIGNYNCFLIKEPQAGNVIPGSGGVRKLRWRTPGKGKRGGYRILYYAKIEQGVIWMLTLYPKNVKENIPAHALREIHKEIENE